MQDEFSLREDMNNDARETKDALSSIARPIKDKAKEELQDRIQQQIAEEAAKAAAKTAAQTAAEAGTMAAGATAEGIAGVGGGAATEAAVTSTVGAGTTVAAGEAAAVGGAAVAEGAAAGAVGGPVGVAIGAAVGALIAAASAIKKATEISIDNEEPDSPKINILAIIICVAAFFLVAVCGPLLSYGIASVFSVNQETEFQNTKYEGKNMSKAGERFMENSSSELNEFRDALPLQNSINDYIWGTEGHTGFRHTLHNAIKEHLQITVEALEYTIPEKEWDGTKTMTWFFDNPWPYDLQVYKGVVYPKIGDVLHPTGTDTWSVPEYDSSYKAKYDDVNWAEIMTILSQNTSEDESHTYALNWGECNYEDYMNFIETEHCQQYMYELGVKWIPIYRGQKVIKGEDGKYITINIESDGKEYEDAEGCRNAPETMIVDGVTCYYEGFWNKTEVRPFGLRELYSLADVDRTQMHYRFEQHTNEYMLDYTERVTRLYQRDSQKIIYGVHEGDPASEIVNALGPSYKETRSELSTIYELLVSDPELIYKGQEGTGRSAWCYIDNTYSFDLEKMQYLYENTFSVTNKDIYDKCPFLNVDGMSVIEMYKWIKQWEYQDKRGSSSTTIAKTGCFDSTVAMIISTMLGKDVSVQEISNRFVNSDGQLDSVAAFKAYGLTEGERIRDNFQQGLISEIDKGNPAVLHIRGY